MLSYDVIVIGGGAAGLMSALVAGRRGRRVLVLDSSNRVGKKILMSGGGRCNFTNLHVEPENYLSANPHFCKSALSRYSQWDFIALVEKHGIAYHERKHGQLFCDNSAKDILAMLLQECDAVGVTIRTHCKVAKIIATRAEPARFEIIGEAMSYTAESLIVATGGLSIPKMGASGYGYDLARQFGLNVLPTRAGLVPLVFDDGFSVTCAALSGVSVDCRVSIDSDRLPTQPRDVSFTEALLFSHRGLTGPVVLQISNYWSETLPIVLDLFPAEDVRDWLGSNKANRPKILLRSALAEKLPKRLVLLIEQLFWPERKDVALAQWADSALESIADQLTRWTLTPSGTQGFATAEVTLGGVDTDEISSKTMESKRERGLYFVGEVVDVTGHLGGYNFQWAWASGFVAGSHA
ncbi:MAG: NAD(P)/FAD-dependent oxidoreductase [Gammaproteobacteria bacterium]